MKLISRGRIILFFYWMALLFGTVFVFAGMGSDPQANLRIVAVVVVLSFLHWLLVNPLLHTKYRCKKNILKNIILSQLLVRYVWVKRLVIGYGILYIGYLVVLIDLQMLVPSLRPIYGKWFSIFNSSYDPKIMLIALFPVVAVMVFLHIDLYKRLGVS